MLPTIKWMIGCSWLGEATVLSKIASQSSSIPISLHLPLHIMCYYWRKNRVRKKRLAEGEGEDLYATFTIVNDSVDAKRIRICSYSTNCGVGSLAPWVIYVVVNTIYIRLNYGGWSFDHCSTTRLWSLPPPNMKGPSSILFMGRDML